MTGATLVTTAEGVATSFNGFLGKFGAAHPRLLAGISLVVGLIAGWLVHIR